MVWSSHSATRIGLPNGHLGDDAGAPPEPGVDGEHATGQVSRSRMPARPREWCFTAAGSNPIPSSSTITRSTWLAQVAVTLTRWGLAWRAAFVRASWMTR